MVLPLDQLSKLGRVEQEFEIIKGLTIKLKTLSMNEQHVALTSVPTTLTDATGQFHHLQKALLVQATESINGEKATKEELDKFYNELQESLFQDVAARYTELLTKQNDTLQELKKKS